MLCAIDTETGGLDHRRHGLIEIAIVPFCDWAEPFNITMRPWKEPDDVALSLQGRSKAEVYQYKFSGSLIDDLEFWKGTNIPDEKIEPVGHNYAFDKEFIIDWINFERYNEMFDYHARDTFALAAGLNDAARARNKEFPFPNGLKLENIATSFGLIQSRPHRALDDALLTREVWLRLLRMLP